MQRLRTEFGVEPQRADASRLGDLTSQSDAVYLTPQKPHQLSLFTDFEQFTQFKPSPHQEGTVHAMLDDLAAWGQALRDLRLRRTK